jgi:hypothetical protein
MALGKALLHYNPKLTQECLQVLALLLSGIGQWKNSIVLIGGLAPEILVKARPPDVPAYVGTADVDLVMDLAVMANPEAYATFEEVLQKNGFVPLAPDGKPSWRWEFTTKSGTKVRLEFVADDPDMEEWKVRAVPEHGQLGALNVRQSSIVFDLSETRTIKVELPGELGITQQDVRHADIVGFTVLKILAFRSRGEGKDAHDLVYCLQHGEHAVDEIADRFVAALKSKHGAVIQHALDGMRVAFGDDAETEGFRKDGPTRGALFEIAGDAPEDRERRLIRQREYSEIVNRLLNAVADRRPA